jgi:hypothetical protein
MAATRLLEEREPSTRGEPTSREQAVRLVRGVMEALVLLLVCLSPWAFGAVEPFLEFLLYSGVAVLLALWAAVMLLWEMRDASRNSFRCMDLCGKRTRAGWRTLSFFNSGGEGSAPASRRALEIGPFPGVRTQPAPPMRLTLTSKRTSAPQLEVV